MTKRVCDLCGAPALLLPYFDSDADMLQENGSLATGALRITVGFSIDGRPADLCSSCVIFHLSTQPEIERSALLHADVTGKAAEIGG
jgi:hypothetical protein